MKKSERRIATFQHTNRLQRGSCCFEVTFEIRSLPDGAWMHRWYRITRTTPAAALDAAKEIAALMYRAHDFRNFEARLLHGDVLHFEDGLD